MPLDDAAAFELPDATRELRETALAFARDRLAPHAQEWDERKHFPVDVLREAAALGMAALYVREESGGAGLSRLDAAVVFEALATGCPTVSAFLSIHNMVAWMIDRFGSDAQRAEWLPRLVGMEKIASYCLTEPGAGSDAAALATRAARDNQGYVLNGVKQFISGAGASDLYLTMVRTGGPGAGGVSALLVPKETPGLSFGANERKMGWNAQPTRQVIFEEARVPAEALLGEEGQGFRFAMQGLDGGRLNIGACSLGGAQRALDIALAYVQERRAFGQEVGKFQATQFRLADMATELEAARTLLWRACAKLDAKAPDATAFCAMAKRLATDTGFRVADEALQLLGGYGYLADYGIEKIVHDLRVHRILEGTNEIMRLIVARSLLGGSPCPAGRGPGRRPPPVDLPAASPILPAAQGRDTGMATRDGAIARATGFFDQGGFQDLLARLVAIPSTSQDPEHAAALPRYLEEAVAPWLASLGFAVTIHANPLPGFGPILTATRIEDPARPTVLLYGHGDTVRGLEDQWRAGLAPWTVTEEGPRWYGRGTADNKGQHAINLAALEAVLAERGRLGFNVKLVLEMAEERGSKGLREFVAAHRDLLAADVLIASDGPRVEPGLPTIATGTRGTYHFDLAVRLREGGVHSGHWGGLTRDPAVLLAHAISTIMDRDGKILVRGWLPQGGVPAAVRGVLEGCPVGGGEGAATIDAEWGEPGLTPAEKIYGWNSFIVLAMVSGRPENPVNAVAPDARATCQIRYTVDVDTAAFLPALRHHLDVHGLEMVRIENAGIRMPASRTAPDHPWVRWTRASMERSLGKPVQVIPNSSGGLPGDVFVDHLGVPLVWIPHSYNGCKQHGPDEHLLKATAREGLVAFTGIWWDLGEAGTPTG